MKTQTEIAFEYDWICHQCGIKLRNGRSKFCIDCQKERERIGVKRHYNGYYKRYYSLNKVKQKLKNILGKDTPIKKVHRKNKKNGRFI